jgi:acetate kinase
LAERLGTDHAHVHVTIHPHFPTSATNVASSTDKTHDFTKAGYTQEDALQYVLQVLEDENVLQHVVAIGHRVVHGGTEFTSSVLVPNSSADSNVLEQLESVSHLAPLYVYILYVLSYLKVLLYWLFVPVFSHARALFPFLCLLIYSHNPHNVHGIRTTLRLCPNIPSIAVFDTSFHATLPPVAYTYPLPKEYRDLQIRKYGFHGTSVMYIVQTALRLLQDMPMAVPRRGEGDDDKDNHYHLIVCHLGNGASITAVSHGQSQDTTMGFTPLAGIMMGTRSGNIDPSILPFSCHALNKDIDQVLNDLNQRSGLCGIMNDGSFDMRELLQDEEKDPKAKLAVDMFVYRLCQGIAEMVVALQGPLDALIFTAGIGEHSHVIRQRAVELLERSLLPQLQLDPQRNQKDGQDSQGVVSPPGVWPVILDIATDEEIMIVKECIRIIDHNQDDEDDDTEKSKATSEK